MRASFRQMLLAVGCVVLLPASVFAQGAISGVVRDSSGGVLPGVTVEAASDALIERMRTVVSDAQGQYKIIDLRPGTYTVTFTLVGFSTVKREGLALSAGVTLPVNAELKVGNLEETITVRGETPVVDVQNTRQVSVLGRNVLDAIPRSRDQALTAALLPGVTASGQQDMGGSGGQIIVQIAIHGGDSNDQTWAVDGMKVAEGGNGARRVLTVADSAVQEYTYETSAISAEVSTGGVRVNLVPKEGGNTFKGTFLVAGTTQAMASDNLTDALKARGLTAVNVVTKVYDVSPAVGGPIKRDRLWFFSTYRGWGSDGLQVGAFFESDPTLQVPNPNRFWTGNTRLTWQATPRNKFSAYFDRQGRDQDYRGVTALITAEAGTASYYPVLYLAQARWTSTLTSRLLFEVAGSYHHENQIMTNTPAYTPGTYPHFEITTGKLTGATSGGNTFNQHLFYTLIGNLSYVTGSHAFRMGWSDLFGCQCASTGDVLPTLRFNNGVPFQVQLSALPRVTTNRVNRTFGLYAQDQWTLHRLTLNLGLRFEYLNEQVDPQDAAAGRYVPARHFDPIYDVPNWKDLLPRLGVAWDVFGTGKTAVKTSLSRYLKQDQGAFAGSVNPFAASSDTRTWTDRNSDRIPQLDELGPSTNLNFGLPVIPTQPADDLREGWGKRQYNWEFAAAVQHELLPGLSVNAGYYRRSYGNLTWTHNTLVSASDYTPFMIVSPLDGERIAMYNLNVAKRGVSNNVIEFAPNDSAVFNGVDLTVTGKFGQGGLVSGGVTTGRVTSSQCTVSDPNQLRFCEISPGFFAQNQYKVIVAYRLPYGVGVSGSFVSVPSPLGVAIPNIPKPGVLANYTVTSALAGVTLTNGSIAVPLVQPGTLFGEWKNQVDLRLGKTIRAGSTRFDPYVDFYNLFNASTVMAENFTYGPLWRQPTDVLIGRVLQLGVQISF
jgi:hypothetical protein